MSELAFHNNDKLNLNPYGDPLGRDAHQGLERFMQKFHQPGVPSHTIITDPDYYVFLWFHNAIGSLIECPYTKGGNYVPKMRSEMHKDFSFDAINAKFEDGIGINGNGQDNPQLPSKCLDLTPFVRDAQLPEIAPANATKIKTLFGETTAGTFSPYVSDGSKSIALQMLDTEYCILDAIFYPWMQDINSPWWYRPDQVYTEWATPYPMATLEVQRPRMRYRKNIQPSDTRGLDDSEYEYYSYRFIGVKPTSYAAFSVNGAGTTNLLRQLTLVADMCIVDILGDAHLSTNGSPNFGNRKNFIFVDSPVQQSQDSPEQGDEKNSMEEARKRAEWYQFQQDNLKNFIEDNVEDIDQQQDGDMPGEDESEEPDGSDPNLDVESEDESQMPDPSSEPSEQSGDPNSAQDDSQQQSESEQDQDPQPDQEFFDKINNDMKDIGKSWVDGSSFPTNSVPVSVTSIASNASGGLFRSTYQPANIPEADCFFNAISKALNEEFEYPGKTTFGLTTPGHIGVYPNSERLEAFSKIGELDNRMSTSFPQIAQKIQVQGDRISEIMKRVSFDEQSESPSLVELTRQLTNCNSVTYDISDEIKELDGASTYISSNLKEIGKLGKNLQDVSDKEGTVGEFGGLIRRMLFSYGNKPTPIETYAEMATKKDAKNSTME